MKIYFNNELIDLPSDYMSLSQFLEWKGLKTSGTAIAVNNKVIRKMAWDSTFLNDEDRITVITAAYGG